MARPEDDRGCLYVHTLIATQDEVRSFYEIPNVVADQVRERLPRGNFVEALVELLADAGRA